MSVSISKELIMETSRSRKSLYEQLSAMSFATDRLIQNKGKHRRQFRLMDEDLQNQFKTLALLVASVKTNYESYLYDVAKEDEELAKKFMPVFLHDKVPVVLAAKDCTLV
jgi:hypothetical protein